MITWAKRNQVLVSRAKVLLGLEMLRRLLTVVE